MNVGYGTASSSASGPSGVGKSNLQPGILHMSSPPPRINVSQATMFFSKFGALGRMLFRASKTKFKNPQSNV